MWKIVGVWTVCRRWCRWMDGFAMPGQCGTLITSWVGTPHTNCISTIGCITSHKHCLHIYCSYLNRKEIRSPRMASLWLICAVLCYWNSQEAWHMCIQWKCLLGLPLAKCRPWISVARSERNFTDDSWLQTTGQPNKPFILLWAPIISLKICLDSQVVI